MSSAQGNFTGGSYDAKNAVTSDSKNQKSGDWFGEVDIKPDKRYNVRKKPYWYRRL